MLEICAACGNTLAASDKFCRVCGRQLSAAPLGPPQIPAPAAPVGSAETSPKAVISLVCGLLFFVPLAFIAAIVFGHLGLSEIRRSAGRLKGEGLAIAGLVLGYLWIAGIPLILIIAAIAIPNLLRARIAANESSAVGTVRTIAAAETTYAAVHPQEGYTCSLSSLTESGLNVPRLASGQRNGYAFELSGCTAGGDGGPNMKYQIVAYPLRVNQTGRQAFCSDEAAVLKVDVGGSPHQCLESGSEPR
jgi:type II secretory pathway pseudopilin PulG